MDEFQEQYALWDQFLKAWPQSRLASMTLDEYTQAGSKETFTYWIESRLDKLGSIWGGSSFKFGVFSRKDIDDKTSDTRYTYSDTHGWYSSLGPTAEDAFTEVRRSVMHVAALGAAGDLQGIDDFAGLGEAYKWKIAFQYQARNAPTIVGIFKKAAFQYFLGNNAENSMAALQAAVVAKRPPNRGILEFGRDVWSDWSRSNLAIWKLSHGATEFSDEERQEYFDRHLAVMHHNTGKKQGINFSEVPIGTLFYLCHGNSPQRLGRFTSGATPSSKGDGWLQRPYRVLKEALQTEPYTASSKYWSPRGNTTFWRVGREDLPEFEQTLLAPYFGSTLAELAEMRDEPDPTEPIDAPINGGAEKPDRPREPVNRIYYGPPGTGKTYTLMKLLEQEYQDSPDVISGDQWRKQMIAERIAVLRWWEVTAAALYDLKGEAKVNELAAHRFIKAIVFTVSGNPPSH